jgi:catechol 2,3-dioxygenase-like lactoylglutathione lyase family enzyme
MENRHGHGVGRARLTRAGARVVQIDHLVLTVSDFTKSREFYGKVLGFLGFEVLDKFPTMMGWTNGKTRLWISAADAPGRKHPHRKGDVGFHHYAFQLRSRRDVDALHAFLTREGFEIADPAGEYYDDYYAVFFHDPDGMRLEGMKWGEKAARRRATREKSRKRPAGNRPRPRA